MAVLTVAVGGVAGNSAVDSSDGSAGDLLTVGENEVSKSLVVADNAVVVLPLDLLDDEIVDVGLDQSDQVAVSVDDRVIGSVVLLSGVSLKLPRKNLSASLYLVSATVVVAATVP